MTEHVQIKSAMVDCWINDYGELIIEIKDNESDVNFRIQEGHVYGGSIPWPTLELYKVKL